MKALFSVLLTRVAVTSLPAHLDVVSRDTGTVTRKETVLMALMSLPLASTLKQHA